VDLLNEKTEKFPKNKFYLCIDIEKIKRYKFKEILKNTGANTQALQQHEPKFFDSIIDGPSNPSIDEWAAYLVYLRNLIPNINLINRRHACESYNLQVKFGNRPLVPVDSSCDANFCDGDITKFAKEHSRSITIQNNNYLSKSQKGQLVRQTTDYYTEAFKNAMRDTNYETSQSLVKNPVNNNIIRAPMVDLWDVMKSGGPMNFSYRYFNLPSNRRPRIREYTKGIWKHCLINEHSDHALFTQMERLKAISWLAKGLFDMEKVSRMFLKNPELFFDHNKDKTLAVSCADCFFPLHSKFKLTGKSCYGWFEEIHEEKADFQARRREIKLEGSITDLLHSNPEELALKSKNKCGENWLGCAKYNNNLRGLVGFVDPNTGHRTNSKAATYGDYVSKPEDIT
jgi:hypothetical protein